MNMVTLFIHYEKKLDSRIYSFVHTPLLTFPNKYNYAESCTDTVNILILLIFLLHLQEILSSLHFWLRVSAQGPLQQSWVQRRLLGE